MGINMGVKSDRWIIEMARDHRMIDPFSESQVRQGISFGVSSYGYDISLSDEFKIFDPSGLDELDPKNNGPANFTDLRADSVLVPANSFVLAQSREYFRIPRDVVTVCTGKSTYARCGIVVNVTPFEPEWEGFATISLANTAPCPVRIYAHEGIAQLLFLEASEICEVSYKDKKGKYQGQKAITLSKADKDCR
jgi:dCTP deaminase